MGRFQGLSAAIATVADKLRKEREMGAETGQKINIMGIEGLMKGTIAPAAQGEQGTTFDLPGMGTFKPVKEPAEWKPQTQEEALGFESAKAGLKKGLTLSNALGILSDHFKSRHIKRTYPNLYKEAEEVVKANLGEEVLSGMTSSPKLPGKVKGKLPTKIIPDLTEESTMDTNW